MISKNEISEENINNLIKFLKLNNKANDILKGIIGLHQMNGKLDELSLKIEEKEELIKEETLSKDENKDNQYSLSQDLFSDSSAKEDEVPKGIPGKKRNYKETFTTDDNDGGEVKDTERVKEPSHQRKRQCLEENKVSRFNFKPI